MSWIEMTWIEMTWIEMAFDMLYICRWDNIIIVLTLPFSSTSVIEFTTPWLFFRPWCFSAVKWAPTISGLNNCWSIALLFSPSIGSNVVSFKIITNGNRLARTPASYSHLHWHIVCTARLQDPMSIFSSTSVICWMVRKFCYLHVVTKI